MTGYRIKSTTTLTSQPLWALFCWSNLKHKVQLASVGVSKIHLAVLPAGKIDLKAQKGRLHSINYSEVCFVGVTCNKPIRMASRLTFKRWGRGLCAYCHDGVFTHKPDSFQPRIINHHFLSVYTELLPSQHFTKCHDEIPQPAPYQYRILIIYIAQILF